VFVEFTQSSRRHKIGRARIRQVMANPVAVVRIEEEADRLVVIHAMDLRAKFRTLNEEGTRP
jgi:hypothetical protein